MKANRLKLTKNLALITFFLLSHILQISCSDHSGLKIKWQKSIDVNCLSPDPIAILTNDNHLIIIGESYFGEEHGFWITKYDASGRQLFKKDYRIEGRISDFSINSFVSDKYGNLMVIGSEFFHGEYRLWLCNLDKTGNEIFIKRYSFKNSISPGSILDTNDGNFIITGTQDFKNVLLIKIDNLGNQVWKKVYETEQVESIALGMIIADQNILIISVEGKLSKFGTGKSNLKITKYNSLGAKNKDISFPGRIIGIPGAMTSNEKKDTFYISYDSSVIPKGNVCIPKNISENVIYITKIDSNLDMIWSKPIGTKWGLIFPPLINHSDNVLILSGNGNLKKLGVDPPWVRIYDIDGNMIDELCLKKHWHFSPYSIVSNKYGIFLVGTEMPIDTNTNSKVIIFNIGYNK